MIYPSPPERKKVEVTFMTDKKKAQPQRGILIYGWDAECRQHKEKDLGNSGKVGKRKNRTCPFRQKIPSQESWGAEFASPVVTRAHQRKGKSITLKKWKDSRTRVQNISEGKDQGPFRELSENF